MPLEPHMCAGWRRGLRLRLVSCAMGDPYLRCWIRLSCIDKLGFIGTVTTSMPCIVEQIDKLLGNRLPDRRVSAVANEG